MIVLTSPELKRNGTNPNKLWEANSASQKLYSIFENPYKSLQDRYHPNKFFIDLEILIDLYKLYMNL